MREARTNRPAAGLILEAERIESYRPRVGIRIPLPEGVRVSLEDHLDGSLCILLDYHRYREHELAATLEKAIAAIRRGPVR